MCREISTGEFKIIANDMLKYIKSVCDENGIQYFLAYGTLLGAVRHKGYIPWDDDIDLYMTRENFCKFAKVMEKNNHSYYKLLSLDTEKNYTLPLPKVINTNTTLTQTMQKEKMPLGVFVDVFILDNIPQNVAKRKYLFKKLKFFQECWSASQYKTTLKGKSLKGKVFTLILLMPALLGSRFWAKKLDTAAQKYNSMKSDSVSSLNFSVYGRERDTIKKDILGNGIELTFEDGIYCAPEKFDDYLTALYGDYMTLPPVEKRCSHHHYKVFYK